MRLDGIAAPRIVVGRCREARVSVRAVCPRPVPCFRRAEVAPQAVLFIVYDTPRLIEAERRVRKWPVNDTSVALAAVGAEAEIVGSEHTGILDRAGIRVPLLVPVRLSTGVVAFLLQQYLVDAHVVAVPGPELSDVVNVVGLDDVRHL